MHLPQRRAQIARRPLGINLELFGRRPYRLDGLGARPQRGFIGRELDRIAGLFARRARAARHIGGNGQYPRLRNGFVTHGAHTIETGVPPVTGPRGP